MKPFANIPGVQYPDPTAPEAKVAPRAPKPLLVYVPRHVTRNTIRVGGRNVSTVWMRKNGLVFKVVDGVQTVVPDGGPC